MIDEPGTELSLPGFMYDEDVKMVKKGIKIRKNIMSIIDLEDGRMLYYA